MFFCLFYTPVLSTWATQRRHYRVNKLLVVDWRLNDVIMMYQCVRVQEVIFSIGVFASLWRQYRTSVKIHLNWKSYKEAWLLFLSKWDKFFFFSPNVKLFGDWAFVSFLLVKYFLLFCSLSNCIFLSRLCQWKIEKTSTFWSNFFIHTLTVPCVRLKQYRKGVRRRKFIRKILKKYHVSIPTHALVANSFTILCSKKKIIWKIWKNSGI